jgi:Anthrone oxygenase
MKKMNKGVTYFTMFLTVLLTGLYAGIGFFGIMGGNPAIVKMSSTTFAEFWQHLDSLMAVRMKIFGPILMITLLLTVLLHLAQWKTPVFWFLLIAFLILIADLIVSFTINHPLNQLIQSWDLNHLPSNVQQIKNRVVTGFYYRNTFMITCFVCVLVALFFKKGNR